MGAVCFIVCGKVSYLSDSFMKTRHSRNSQCFARGRTNVQLQDVFVKPSDKHDTFSHILSWRSCRKSLLWEQCVFIECEKLSCLSDSFMKARHARNSQCFARGKTNVQLQEVVFP